MNVVITLMDVAMVAKILRVHFSVPVQVDFGYLLISVLVKVKKLRNQN